MTVSFKIIITNIIISNFNCYNEQKSSLSVSRFTLKTALIELEKKGWNNWPFKGFFFLLVPLLFFVQSHFFLLFFALPLRTIVYRLRAKGEQNPEWGGMLGSHFLSSASPLFKRGVNETAGDGDYHFVVRQRAPLFHPQGGH